MSHICDMKISSHFPSGAYMRHKSLYFSYRPRGRPTKQCQAKMSFKIAAELPRPPGLLCLYAIRYHHKVSGLIYFSHCDFLNIAFIYWFDRKGEWAMSRFPIATLPVKSPKEALMSHFCAVPAQLKSTYLECCDRSRNQGQGQCNCPWYPLLVRHSWYMYSDVRIILRQQNNSLLSRGSSGH